MLLMVDDTEKIPDELNQIHLPARLGEDLLEALNFTSVEVIEQEARVEAFDEAVGPVLHFDDLVDCEVQVWGLQQPIV
jgi:hypothetical protein